ncbi:mRNA-decapping enzyme subunit 1 [Ceratobasidium sp. AG-Ba]|nr:mRNA-decapping enzyme subunit 1 [Ceratobasidium sp. AG-Ba]QRW10937.1 mRNA-decapping enzyme subunit 1 [Ceratobasidium sp. AG-Ba]
MSAASRKAWNLKVIQRHDPDILCIWDQYRFGLALRPDFLCYVNAILSNRMVKNSGGRRGLPRYGFFILNRSSSQNYMHLLTAEDNLEVQESYVIFRAKGSKDAPVLGLWASDPDHRKHLGDTLLGLHNHIKSGSSAPFYDPATAFGSGPAQSSPEAPTLGAAPSANYSSQATNSANNTMSLGPSTGMQSLNDLFARLSSSASANNATPNAPEPPHPPFYTTSAPAQSSSTQTKSFSPPQSTPASTGPLRGQALLDSLFAMASPTPAPAAPQTAPPTNPSTLSSSQLPSGPSGFGAPTPTSQPQTATQLPAPTGGDLLAQLFANINSTQPPATGPSKSTNHSRQPSTPPPASTLPPDPAILHSTKVTPDPPRNDRRRNPIRRGGYATDTSPRPIHSHSHSHNRISVFNEDATGHSRNASLTGDEVLASNGSTRSKPRSGRALVPFQSDTGPEYHPDPTRPHVSSRYPAGMNGEEEQVYAMGGGIEEEAEDEIFYDGRAGKGQGPSPRRQKKRQKNGRGGGTNGNGNGRQSDVVNLDRQLAGEVLMQGIEWDDGVVDKDLFLQSIYALLSEQEFVDQLYNDYKIAQTRQT